MAQDVSALEALSKSDAPIIPLRKLVPFLAQHEGVNLGLSQTVKEFTLLVRMESYGASGDGKAQVAWDLVQAAESRASKAGRELRPWTGASPTTRPDMLVINSCGSLGASVALVARMKGYLPVVCFGSGPDGVGKRTADSCRQLYAHAGAAVRPMLEKDDKECDPYSVSFIDGRIAPAPGKGAIDVATAIEKHFNSSTVRGTRINVGYVDQFGDDADTCIKAYTAKGVQIASRINKMSLPLHVFVCATVTGSMLTGIGNGIKQTFPRVKPIRVALTMKDVDLGVCPAGCGQPNDPVCVDLDFVSKVHRALQLAEGLMVGPITALNVAGALRAAKDYQGKNGKLVVCTLASDRSMPGDLFYVGDRSINLSATPGLPFWKDEELKKELRAALVAIESSKKTT